MSTSNTKSNGKTFHERKSQNLSQVYVSLDNADSVIEGGRPFMVLTFLSQYETSGAPFFAHFAKSLP